MASEYNNIFSSKLDCEDFYYLIYIFSINNDVCTYNISMEQNICRLHDGVKHDIIADFFKTNH